MGIRKVTALDFGYLRRLPVQLLQPASSTLLPKKLRQMMNDPNVRLLVFDADKKITAFIALAFSPSLDSVIRFLVITHFATDRFGDRLGIAAEMEAYAVSLATENRATAVLVNNEGSRDSARKFFEQMGYAVTGEALIKTLSYL